MRDDTELAETIENNVAHVCEVLKPWAAHMAARYDAAVYLCGSTLHSPTPRDCDIRIVVEDPAFAERYGYDLHKIELDEHHPLRRRSPSLVGAAVVRFSEEGPTQAWIDDVAKFNRALVGRLRRVMDVQVVPDSYWRVPYPAPICLAAPSKRWFVYTKHCPDPSGEDGG